MAPTTIEICVDSQKLKHLVLGNFTFLEFFKFTNIQGIVNSYGHFGSQIKFDHLQVFIKSHVRKLKKAVGMEN